MDVEWKKGRKERKATGDHPVVTYDLREMDRSG